MSEDREDLDTGVQHAYLWELANDMRELESSRSGKNTHERLARYKRLRAELERELSEAEGVQLPEEHVL